MNPLNPSLDTRNAENHRVSRARGWMALAGIAVLSLAACHDEGHGPDEPVDCSTETRADTYVANLTKAGANGYQLVLVQSQPAPPSKGDNTWTVQLLDDAGAPVDGASLSATPFMPDHGHGTPIVTETTPAGANGEYELAPVNLWMPGLWEVTVDMDVQGTTDSVIYAFCIDG